MSRILSICVPVFNEKDNVSHVVQEVERVFADELSRYQLEIVFTDNASTDGTWEMIRELAKTKPHIRGYRFSRNFGYQNSIFAGLSMATGDAIIELDADLEDSPRVIPKFVKEWEAGYDVVYGVRSKRHEPWMMRSLFSLFYWLMNRISDIEIPRQAGDFRLIDRKVANMLTSLGERNLYLRGLVSYLGFKQTAVPYERDPRAAGQSKFNLLRYVIMGVDALTAFTKTPLRMIGLLGVVLFILSMALAANFFFGKIFHGVPVQGFTTLVVLILFLHSMTFIFLGVLGEYLSRVFDDAKNRPRAIIAESTHGGDFPRAL